MSTSAHSANGKAGVVKFDSRAIVVDFIRGEELIPNPRNPRGPVGDEDVASLKLSIERDGIQQPLKVTPGGIIVIGHRRHRAGMLAARTEKWNGLFPCVIEEMPEEQQMEVMLIENLERQDLNPFQEATGYMRLLETHGTVASLARRLNVSNARISQALKILDMPDDVRKLFAAERLALATLDALELLTDPARRSFWANHVATANISAGTMLSLIKQELGIKKKPQLAKRRRAEPNSVESKNEALLIRTEITEKLDRVTNRSLLLGDIVRALDKTMCACCDAESPEQERVICNSCPFSRFLNRLAEGITDV